MGTRAKYQRVLEKRGRFSQDLNRPNSVSEILRINSENK